MEQSFREWLDRTYYQGFDPSGLSDEEYYELEDQYNAENCLLWDNNSRYKIVL